jgi:hypothetical protein
MGVTTTLLNSITPQQLKELDRQYKTLHPSTSTQILEAQSLSRNAETGQRGSFLARVALENASVSGVEGESASHCRNDKDDNDGGDSCFRDQRIEAKGLEFMSTCAAAQDLPAAKTCYEKALLYYEETLKEIDGELHLLDNKIRSTREKVRGLRLRMSTYDRMLGAGVAIPEVSDYFEGLHAASL